MKSIFWKMFLIFTGISLLSFLIMAMFFYIQIDDLVWDIKIETLNLTAIEIYMQINNTQTDLTSVPHTYSELEERNDFADKIRLYAQNTNALIWVINEDGRIIAVSQERKNDEKFFVRDFYNRTERYMFDKTFFEPYFKTNETEMIATKNFADIYLDEEQEPGLSYVKTFKLYDRNSMDDSKIGIYIHLPKEELTVVRQEILAVYIIPWILAVIVAGVLIFLFSKSFSKPVRGMVKIAEKVAAGDFHARIEKSDRADEIGKLQNTFNDMLDQIENLELSRQAFISDLSHELRTPITSIRGFVDGMLDGTIPEDKKTHYLEIVKIETGRLNRLIDDLMMLTRLENKDKLIEKTVFDMNELIRHVIIYLEGEINDKTLNIEVNFEDIKTMVKANRDDMERVIVNLMDNAIKFTPSGKNIYISTRAIKDKILVSIKDEGAGIGSEKLKLIWERFYKVDSARSHSKKGSGLGLSIVQKIINSHGEKIEVNSEKNKGTEFSFTVQQGI